MTAVPITPEPISGNLAEMIAVIREINEANGWYEDDREWGDDLALLHSEISETLEAFRQWGFEDKTARVSATGCVPKPEGVGSELADVLIRLLDTVERRSLNASWLGLHLDDVEPAHLPPHGPSFGSLIADLHRIVASGNLGFLLPALKAVARAAGVDLLTETRRKIDYNRTRGYRHGGKRL